MATTFLCIWYFNKPFFIGPLVAGQSHKQEVAAFCQQKIRRAMDETVQLLDRQSYSLLWELLLLLLRQNGTIVGTDIAELLLKDHEILKEPVVQVKGFFRFRTRNCSDANAFDITGCARNFGAWNGCCRPHFSFAPDRGVCDKEIQRIAALWPQKRCP